ncbi:MAG TPA: hypothetical protein VNA19_17075 [Pyrinomonadaceae bacterium]|jgi:hypothetical protein|nr:hypothetical protein [Pyrinomonadaceae bacterium]
MLYRKLMSFAFALSLIFAAGAGEGRGAPLEVQMKRPAGAQAKRITSRKKRVKQNPKNTSASATPDTWGGEHIRLVLTEGGAEIEYDCAHGKISEPLVPDAGGRFDVRGTHLRQSPGPIRVGREPVGQPARYTGTIQDRTMTLNVTLDGRTEPLGSFTLTRGSEGRLWKCR